MAEVGDKPEVNAKKATGVKALSVTEMQAIAKRLRRWKAVPQMAELLEEEVIQERVLA